LCRQNPGTNVLGGRNPEIIVQAKTGNKYSGRNPETIVQEKKNSTKNVPGGILKLLCRGESI
jgi:hypothetical protein